MGILTRFRRRLLSFWSVLLVVAGVGAVVYVAIERGSTAEDADAAHERPAVPVEVTAIKAMTLEETVRGVGTLRAMESVEIRPEVAGRIREIGFREGTEVQEGQLLFKIDDQKLLRQHAAARAGLRAAEVRVADAQRIFDRVSRLREQNVAPQEELAQAEVGLERTRAEREGAEAELSLIEEQLNDTDVRAPFTGLISERQVDRGAYVTVGQTLATLYRTDLVEISFTIPERHMGRVEPGQSVQVSLAAYPDQVFEGVVTFISPVVDEVTRSFQIKAEIPNPERRLKPGAFATSVVTVGVRENRPVVPEESLVATRRGYMVFVVEEERANAREITTGLRRDGMVEVLDGLEVGDVVVRAGHLRLSGGDSIAVVNDGIDLSADQYARPVDGAASPMARDGDVR